MEKLIITAALTGAETTRQDNPSLPLTPAEIAQAAMEAEKSGAAIIHLHVRDEAGRPTQDRGAFAKAINLIRAQSDMIIQVSTGGAAGMTPQERIQPVTLGTEMASLTAGSVNFGDGTFVNSPRDIENFAHAMAQYGVTPEIEVFDVGMINNAMTLVHKGLLRLPLHFGLVLGVPGGIPATPKNLLHLVESLPPGCSWSVAGIGRHELPLGVMGIIMGGHVRVGFEDNVYYRKGMLASSNAQLVARISRLASELGRETATPSQARGILGLK